jgi:hypothetical protein
MTPPNRAVLAYMENTFPLGLGMANLATRVVIVGLFLRSSGVPDLSRHVGHASSFAGVFPPSR